MKIKSKTVKIIIFVLAIAALCVAAYFSVSTIISVLAFFISLFLPFILGYLFSLITNPVADFLQKRLKLPRSISAILVLILILGILGSIIGFAVWKIVDESRNLYTQMPYIFESIRSGFNSFYERISGLYSSMPENIRTSIENVGSNLSEKIASYINLHSSPAMGYASDFAKSLPGIFVGMVVFLLSSYFMIADSAKVSAFVNRFVPQRHRDKMHRVKNEIKHYLGAYVKAQGILMCITFAILITSLSILKIRFALLIALGIAFLDALPFFGSGAALWPWAIVSFINSNIRVGVGLIITYVAIVLVRQFIEPKIVSAKIGMHPLMTLMSMYIGYRLLSVGGMILGPVTMMFVLSLYKAGIFDGLIAFIRRVGEWIKTNASDAKNYIISFIKSE